MESTNLERERVATKGRKQWSSESTVIDFFTFFFYFKTTAATNQPNLLGTHWVFHEKIPNFRKKSPNKNRKKINSREERCTLRGGMVVAQGCSVSRDCVSRVLLCGEEMLQPWGEEGEKKCCKPTTMSPWGKEERKAVVCNCLSVLLCA